MEWKSTKSFWVVQDQMTESVLQQQLSPTSNVWLGPKPMELKMFFAWIKSKVLCSRVTMQKKHIILIWFDLILFVLHLIDIVRSTGLEYFKMLICIDVLS